MEPSTTPESSPPVDPNFYTLDQEVARDLARARQATHPTNTAIGRDLACVRQHLH